MNILLLLLGFFSSNHSEHIIVDHSYYALGYRVYEFVFEKQTIDT